MENLSFYIGVIGDEFSCFRRGYILLYYMKCTYMYNLKKLCKGITIINSYTYKSNAFQHFSFPSSSDTHISCKCLVGNIISVLLFLSPISTFWKIVMHGSTEEYESLPYICTLLNSSLWTYYGLIKPGEYLIATINGFGIVVEAVYVILFLIYAPKYIKAKTTMLAGILNVGFLGTAILATQLALEGEARINAIGVLGAGLNIIMYGSPLAAMRTVVSSKSVEYMPFLLSFFIFLNSVIWTLYSFLFRDYFLGVPNVIGVLLGLAQLVLYGMYRNPKASKNVSSKGNGLEDGRQQHEPLISSDHASNI